MEKYEKLIEMEQMEKKKWKKMKKNEKNREKTKMIRKITSKNVAFLTIGKVLRVREVIAGGLGVFHF